MNIPVYGNIVVVYINFCAVCLKQSKTKMLRLYSFSIFAIKTPRVRAALAQSCLLIMNTLTNVLYYKTRLRSLWL